MKFLNVILGILLVTATAAAQSPFYGYPYNAPYGYPYYNSSTYGYPYSTYGYPYYLNSPYPSFANQVVPYYPNLVPDPFSRATSEQLINDLMSQVQRLTDEVERLQAQLVQAMTQPPPAPVTTTEPSPGPPPDPLVLVFKDGKRLESQGYAISGDTLWVLAPAGGHMAVGLSEIDLAATRKENAKRGIDFPIPR